MKKLVTIVILALCLNTSNAYGYENYCVALTKSVVGEDGKRKKVKIPLYSAEELFKRAVIVAVVEHKDIVAIGSNRKSVYRYLRKFDKWHKLKIIKTIKGKVGKTAYVAPHVFGFLNKSKLTPASKNKGKSKKTFLLFVAGSIKDDKKRTYLIPSECQGAWSLSTKERLPTEKKLSKDDLKWLKKNDILK